jgi:hypothetical protein
MNAVVISVKTSLLIESQVTPTNFAPSQVMSLFAPSLKPCYKYCIYFTKKKHCGVC